MSTIQIPRNWQPEPKKKLVQSFPVKEGAKLCEQELCVICSTPKRACVFDSQNAPLVAICPRCGHKSWAKVI